MFNLKMLLLFCVSFFIISVNAALVETHSFDFSQSIATEPFLMLRGKIQFQINTKCSNEEGGKLKITLYNMKNEKLETICDVNDIPEGKESYSFSCSYKGFGYLKIEAIDTTCTVNIFQELSEIEKKELKIKEGQIFRSFDKVATWTGTAETVSYDLYLKTSVGRLILVSGLPEEIILTVENQQGEKVIFFKGKVMKDQLFTFYTPGYYRITITAKKAWILHALALKGK